MKNILKNKLKLIEHLPQVGSYRIDLHLISNDNILIENEFIGIILDFIVDCNGDMFIGKGHYKLSNKSEELLMAGELMINSKNKISFISNNSGHYRPSIEFLNNFIDILKKETNLIDDNITIRNYVW